MIMKQICQKLAALSILAFLLSPVVAAENPYLQPDESWISISGVAVDTEPGSFKLDYGSGIITVEMDGWEWYEEGYLHIEGDRVKVYGEIDDDLYETASIEASSVYDETIGKYFYASTEDEDYEDDYDYWFEAEPLTPGETVIRGTVTSINGRDFTIDKGTRETTVDTSSLLYNPLDDLGVTEIDVGDYVSASGHVEDDFFEGRELIAESVTVLVDD